MTNPATIANCYIATWNETDEDLRKASLKKSWSEYAAYVDPMASANGHGAIAALIGAVHQKFPGFRFALDGRPDGYADKVRFSWTLGPESEPGMVKGTDFAVIENGRLKRVTGFLDKIPSAG